MHIASVVEVLSAAHQSYLVVSPPEFSARSGLMFVAPVGHVKTAITKTLDGWKPQAHVGSDLTIRQLSEMQEEISQGKIRTIGFMEFPKIYARNKDVAANVEGALQQMADEGFRIPNWLPQNMTVKEARCLIVGAMPITFYKRKWAEWTHSGFARRFLWCHFQLQNPEIIMDAIDRWMPLDFGKQIYSFPAQNSIPFSCSETESAFLRGILRQTKAGYEAVPFILLKKILCVLKWRHEELGRAGASRKAIAVMADFSECLQGVADLQIDLKLTGDEAEKKPSRSATKVKRA